MSNHNNDKGNNKPQASIIKPTAEPVQKLKLPAETFEIEPAKTTAETVETVETALVNFAIPEMPVTPGAEKPDAGVSTLNYHASNLARFAADTFKSINERLSPIYAAVDSFGGECGRLENETDDQYYGRTVEFSTGSVTVKMAVSLIFSNTVKAVVRTLVSGNVQIDKFKDLILSSALLKKADEEGNFGKEDKAILHSHGEFLFGVRAVGLDTNGRMKRFYELLMKSTIAVFKGDELAAMGKIDHLAKVTGIKRDVLVQLVQLMIEAKVARDARKASKDFQKRATEANQAMISRRREAETVANLERVRAKQEGATAH